jgi:hypothetical protein
MAYNITIEEIQNGITVATVNDLGINVTVEEVVNGITITPPVVNQLSVTNIEYPVTVSYNGIIVQDGGGIAANGLPAGGSIGQFLRKQASLTMMWPGPISVISTPHIPCQQKLPLVVLT